MPLTTTPVAWAHPMQLDIFNDSHDLMLRNDLIAALCSRDLPVAAAVRRADLALSALAADYPADTALADGRLLIDSLAAEPVAAPFETGMAAAAARGHLETAVVPAAARLLGRSDAGPWLAGRWAHLADRAAALPYRADGAAPHAAALYLRAGRWRDAMAAAEGIASWRQIPAPLAWAAESRWHLSGLDTAWPLLAELALRAPPRFEALARALPDAALRKLLRRFDTQFELEAGLDGDAGRHPLAWFPAWALVDQPALATVLDGPIGAPGRLPEHGSDNPPASALQHLLALARLERHGRSPALIEHRKHLRSLHAGLFDTYMATR